MSGSKPLGRGLRGLQGDYSRESANITDVHCLNVKSFIWLLFIHMYVCVCSSQECRANKFRTVN